MSAPNIPTKRLRALAVAAEQSTQGEGWAYSLWAKQAQEHLKRVFDGDNQWDRYSSEPKYRAYKLALVGHDKPGRWLPGRERLAPSFFDAQSPWHLMKIEQGRLLIGSKLSYAQQFFSGGRNQFGEVQPERPIVTSDETRAAWAREHLEVFKARVDLLLAEV